LLPSRPRTLSSQLTQCEELRGLEGAAGLQTRAGVVEQRLGVAELPGPLTNPSEGYRSNLGDGLLMMIGSLVDEPVALRPQPDFVAGITRPVAGLAVLEQRPERVRHHRAVFPHSGTRYLVEPLAMTVDTDEVRSRPGDRVARGRRRNGC